MRQGSIYVLTAVALFCASAEAISHKIASEATIWFNSGYGLQIDYFYNDNGLISKLRNFSNKEGSTEISSTKEYKMLDSERWESVNSFDTDGKLSSTISRKYDDQKNVIEEIVKRYDDDYKHIIKKKFDYSTPGYAVMMEYEDWLYDPETGKETECVRYNRWKWHEASGQLQEESLSPGEKTELFDDYIKMTEYRHGKIESISYDYYANHEKIGYRYFSIDNDGTQSWSGSKKEIIEDTSTETKTTIEYGVDSESGEWVYRNKEVVTGHIDYPTQSGTEYKEVYYWDTDTQNWILYKKYSLSWEKGNIFRSEETECTGVFAGNTKVRRYKYDGKGNSIGTVYDLPDKTYYVESKVDFKTYDYTYYNSNHIQIRKIREDRSFYYWNIYREWRNNKWVIPSDDILFASSDKSFYRLRFRSDGSIYSKCLEFINNGRPNDQHYFVEYDQPDSDGIIYDIKEYGYDHTQLDMKDHMKFKNLGDGYFSMSSDQQYCEFDTRRHLEYYFRHDDSTDTWIKTGYVSCKIAENSFDIKASYTPETAELIVSKTKTEDDPDTGGTITTDYVYDFDSPDNPWKKAKTVLKYQVAAPDWKKFNTPPLMRLNRNKQPVSDTSFTIDYYETPESIRYATTPEHDSIEETKEWDLSGNSEITGYRKVEYELSDEKRVRKETTLDKGIVYEVKTIYELNSDGMLTYKGTVNNNGIPGTENKYNEAWFYYEDGLLVRALYNDREDRWAYDKQRDLLYPAGVEDIELPEDNNFSEDMPVEVYNLSGIRVSDSMKNLAPGIYIVRQGAKSRKISVR